MRDTACICLFQDLCTTQRHLEIERQNNATAIEGKILRIQIGLRHSVYAADDLAHIGACKRKAG